MATADEKKAKDAARQAAAQSVVADRERAAARTSGALAGLKLRAAGDLSRYNINYTDDPSARTSSTTPKAATGGGSTTRGVGPTGTTTTTTKKPSVSARRISDGSRPVSGALYETNPKPPSGTYRKPGVLGSMEGSLPLKNPPVNVANAARGMRPGTIYEGRGDPLTGASLTDLQKQRRAVMGTGTSSAKMTREAAAAAMGKAKPGSLYEGRGAAETGKTAAQLKAAKLKAGAAATKAAAAKKVTTQRTTAAAQGKAQKGALYEGRKDAATGSTAKQLKAATPKKVTADAKKRVTSAKPKKPAPAKAPVKKATSKPVAR